MCTSILNSAERELRKCTGKAESSMGVKIIKEGFTFDDVLIVPSASRMVPSEASLKINIAGIELSVPFLSAAMDRVTEARMAIALGKLGGLGVIHRNCSISDQVAMVGEAKK